MKPERVINSQVRLIARLEETINQLEVERDQARELVKQLQDEVGELRGDAPAED